MGKRTATADGSAPATKGKRKRSDVSAPPSEPQQQQQQHAASADQPKLPPPPQQQPAAAAAAAAAGTHAEKPGKKRKSKGPALPAAVLTALLKGSQELGVLLAMVQQQEAHLDSSLVSVALTAAAQLTKLGGKNQPSEHTAGIQALASMAVRHVAGFDTRQLPNAVWSLAKLQHRDPHTIQPLLDAAMPKLSQCDDHGIGNLAWALASLGHKDPAFMRALMDAARPRLQEFNDIALRNVIWACATLGCADRPFLSAAVEAVTSKVSSFSVRTLCTTLWAMASIGYANPPFLKQLMEQARPQLHTFNAQDFSNFVWSLATLDVSCGGFLTSLLAAATPKLSTFGPQALANTLWALATLGHRDEAFVTQLLLHARNKLHEFLPQHLANTAWALATLMIEDPGFMDALVAWVVRTKLAQMKRVELCNTLWALAILQHSATPEGVVVPLLRAAAGTLLGPAAAREPPRSIHLTQAFQYIVTMEHKGHLKQGVIKQQLPQFQELRAACRAGWEVETSQHIESKSHMNILAAVRQLPGCSHAKSEQRTEDGLLSMDISFVLPDGTKVAVEADGQRHYMSNCDVLNGATVWRNRMLDINGWKLVSVPTQKWEYLGGNVDPQKPRSYLLTCFEEAGVKLSG